MMKTVIMTERVWEKKKKKKKADRVLKGKLKLSLKVQNRWLNKCFLTLAK